MKESHGRHSGTQCIVDNLTSAPLLNGHIATPRADGNSMLLTDKKNDLEHGVKSVTWTI